MKRRMKTIELIDKYEVHQSEEGDYNPPSYIWVDNTGELIRCKDCKHNDEGLCRWHYGDDYRWNVDDNDYCSVWERKVKKNDNRICI